MATRSPKKRVYRQKPEQTKDVSIKRAQNGWVVSQWNGSKQRTKIASTKAEAQKYAMQMLGL